MSDWRENLSALPDIDKAMEHRAIGDDGVTVIHRRPLAMVPFPMKSSDPAAFTDADGSWVVIYGYAGGPHKRRMSF